LTAFFGGSDQLGSPGDFLSVGDEMRSKAFTELLRGSSSLSRLNQTKKKKILDEMETNPTRASLRLLFTEEYRGWLDIPFIPIKWAVAAVTALPEFIIKNIGAVPSYLLNVARNKKAPMIGRIGAGLLGAVLWPVGQLCFIAGNTLGYARRTVNAACNLVVSAMAFWDRGKVYPSIKNCVKSLVKNAVLFAVNGAAIVGGIFTAGIVAPLIPAGIAAITSLSPIVSAAAWAGVGVALAGAASAVSAVVQGVTGFFSKTFTSFFKIQTKKVATNSAAVAPLPDSKTASHSTRDTENTNSPVVIPSASTRASVVARLRESAANTPDSGPVLSVHVSTVNSQKKQDEQVKKDEQTKHVNATNARNGDDPGFTRLFQGLSNLYLVSKAEESELKSKFDNLIVSIRSIEMKATAANQYGSTKVVYGTSPEDEKKCEAFYKDMVDIAVKKLLDENKKIKPEILQEFGLQDTSHAALANNNISNIIVSFVKTLFQNMLRQEITDPLSHQSSCSEMSMEIMGNNNAVIRYVEGAAAKNRVLNIEGVGYLGKEKFRLLVEDALKGDVLKKDDADPTPVSVASPSRRT
jgi:hypothetical protein